ncbi:MAG: 50S ribosomal protein L4 [Leptospirillia bacterium]
MAQIDVIAQTGKKSGKVEVSDDMFGRPQNVALMHEAVVRHLASVRQGTHATKTRGEVRGGGRKPWRQKGSGRARAGSTRSPLWKGGGTVFGPQPRDHAYRMPKKKVRLALQVALSDALREGRVSCLAKLEMKTPKTKEFATFAEKLGATDGALFVVDEITENVGLASRNLPGVQVVEASDLTIYDVVLAEKLFFTKAAVGIFGETSDES